MNAARPVLGGPRRVDAPPEDGPDHGDGARRHALVTGAAGFVGSHLVDRLTATGWTVTATIHTTVPRRSASVNPALRWVHADVRDAETLREEFAEAHCVFHVAAATRGSPAELDSINRTGTAGMLDAAARHGRRLERFVYVSSLAAGGPANGDGPLEEDTPPRPIDAYGRSKLAAEKECLARCDRVPVAIIRPPFVLGARDRGSYPLFRLVQHHVRVSLRGPERAYSWIHVADLVRGLIRAAATPVHSGQIFYMAAATTVGWDELQRRIAQALGTWTVPVGLPYGALYAYAAVGETIASFTGRHPVVHRDKARQARAARWTCSARKAERALGFRAVSDLGTALADAIGWYRRLRWL